MAEGFHEEGIVPAGAFDFAPYGCGVGVGSQDVEGEPAQNGEVLGSIVLPRPIAILGEMDVKHPMELVLDGPVTAGDVQQPLRRHVFGQEKVANDRRPGALVLQASPRGDPAHRCNTRKPMNCSQAGVTHDGRASRFAAVVSGLVDLLGGAALARSRKLLGDGCEQGPPVGFDRQNIIAAALEYRVGKGAVEWSASAVTMHPSRHSRSSTSKAPLVSLRPGAFC